MRRHEVLYRTLTGLYPRVFRTAYRDDLVAAFALQLLDERPARVWLRTMHDLLATVPAQHLEAHVHRPSPHAVAITAVSIAVGTIVLAVLSGAGPVAWVLVPVALVALAVAASAEATARPLPSGVHAPGSGWKPVLGGGIALVAAIVVAINGPWGDDDLPELLWAPMMLGLVLGVALVAAGAAMGLARWVAAGRARPRAV